MGVYIIKEDFKEGIKEDIMEDIMEGIKEKYIIKAFTGWHFTKDNYFDLKVVNFKYYYIINIEIYNFINPTNPYWIEIKLIVGIFIIIDL